MGLTNVWSAIWLLRTSFRRLLYSFQAKSNPHEAGLARGKNSPPFLTSHQAKFVLIKFLKIETGGEGFSVQHIAYLYFPHHPESFSKTNLAAGSSARST